MLGMEFKNAKLISSFNINQYLPKNSDKTKPMNVSDIVNDYENNFLRSNIFYPDAIYVSGNSGNLSIDEDIFSDKKYYVLELIDKNSDDSVLKIKFNSPTIVETISSGTYLIIYGKLDQDNNLINPKFRINLNQKNRGC